MKRVLCATLIADAYGPANATGKEIAAIERILRKGLLSVRATIKRKGFVLRLTR